MGYKRSYSLSDRLVMQIDAALNTLLPSQDTRARVSPAETSAPDSYLDKKARRDSGRLMRVNHTGEVCAQALYQGQSLTAKSDRLFENMSKSAEDERDHLVWCSERLKQLDTSVSILNPFFYFTSFLMGAAVSSISEEVSLGFVSATEELVAAHIRQHLIMLSPKDFKSRAILKQMLVEEEGHSRSAMQAGGRPFPLIVKLIMGLASKVMTKTTRFF